MIATACSARASSIDTCIKQLSQLVGGLEKHLGVPLPLPTFSVVSDIKQFCSGLLDPGTEHPWRPVIASFPLKKRLMVMGTLFMFRKVLPAKTPDLEDYLTLLGTASAPVSDSYLRFIDQEIGRVFRVGWDHRYPAAVRGYSPSVSACMENSRGCGGSRGLLVDARGESLREFTRELLARSSPWRVTNRVKVMEALCDGKVRLVTVPSATQQRLGPLHTALYNHLSDQPWLLRGEATPQSFLSFARKRGESFVSGDYEQATDNLNLDVAKHILQCILRRCSRVPLWLRDCAMGSLQCQIVEPLNGTVVMQQRGQLMGNFLSFPLLCLQNYLAFKYLVPREGVPVRINGDDIVFRARPEEVSRWKSGVLAAGLKLSEGKTSISPHWFSLNSTFFVAGQHGVSLAPIVRSTHLFKRLESPSGLADRVNTVAAGMPASERYLWQEMVLRRFQSDIHRLQRSVRRGLGIRVPGWLLKKVGLLEREDFYLSLPSEPSLPSVTVGYKQESIPPGWKRVRQSTAVDRAREACFFELVHYRSWTAPFTSRKGDAWLAARSGTFSCTAWLRFLRSTTGKGLYDGLSARRRWCSWVRPPSGRPCWVQCESTGVQNVEVDVPCTSKRVVVRFPRCFPPPPLLRESGWMSDPKVEYPRYSCV